jgi:hypothetical protein
MREVLHKDILLGSSDCLVDAFVSSVLTRADTHAHENVSPVSASANVALHLTVVIGPPLARSLARLASSTEKKYATPFGRQLLANSLDEVCLGDVVVPVEIVTTVLRYPADLAVTLASFGNRVELPFVSGIVLLCLRTLLSYESTAVWKK